MFLLMPSHISYLMSGVHCRVHASSVSGWLLCTYSTACSVVVQCIYFKPRLSSEVTEEPKKIDDMGNEKGLFFI